MVQIISGYTYDTERDLTTTFPMDFMIANKFGKKAVRDTYKRAMAEWKTNVEYMIHFVVTLNQLCWYLWGKDTELSKLYSDLYYKAHHYCLGHFKGDELTTYFEAVD